MTFNTTVLCVEQLKRAGFVERQFTRLRPGFERKRIVMLPKAIDAMLSADSPQFPRAWVAVAFDEFRAGWRVSVSRREKPKADFKLLKDVDEVWAYSFRKPKDWQARLLGRFVQKNIFVGIDLQLRATLGNKQQYHAAAEKVAADWDSTTGSIKPLRSRLNSDYLSDPILDLDL